MLNKVIWVFISIVSCVQSQNNCYEEVDFQRYIPFCGQLVFVKAFSVDSTTLQPDKECVIVSPEWFVFLNQRNRFAWKSRDWLSIRLATNDDAAKYMDTLRIEEDCPGKLVTSKGKYGGMNVSDMRPECKVVPPIVVKVGCYERIQNSIGYRGFGMANVFMLSTCDSVSIGLYIDTLFDGMYYSERSKAKFDRSNIKKVTYKVIFASRSHKGYGGGYENSYNLEFGSYPVYNLYHLPNDETMFILQGREVEGDGISVHEFNVNARASITYTKTTDLSIGDQVVHKTEYFIENGNFKRKVTAVDNNGRPDYRRLIWKNMWLPDN